MANAPSGYRVEQVMAVWQSARARMLTEGYDEAEVEEMLGPEAADVEAILSRLLTAEQFASSIVGATKELMANLSVRKARYERRSEAARSTLFAIMDTLGRRKWEAPHGTVSIVDGRPSVQIIDEAALPERFWDVIVTRKPNKDMIKTAIDDGEVIPGVERMNGLPSLRIRGK